MKKIFIGIDVSSETLDICIKDSDDKKSYVIKNEVKSITKFFKQFNAENCFIAMENTGRYNWHLYHVFAKFVCTVFVIPPLHLKKSLGLIRGKSDKIDAVRIAQFAEKNYQELQVWKPMPDVIKKLKVLLSERNLRINQKKQLQQQKTTYKLLNLKKGELELDKLNKQLITSIDKQINIIEEKIESLINEDQSLKTQANLIKTVPGVGNVLCWFLLTSTEGFQRLTDARKLACYSGVVPFENQSGTSIRGKARLSVYADKKLKSLLHLSAMSAIRLNNDLRTYYLRKVEEGKNKMSVLNAIRNKIIHRVIAVVKTQKPYNFDLVLS
jgi:transposase